MVGCFAPSKLDALQREADALRESLHTKQDEIERLYRQDLLQKQKEEQQTEALLAAAAHVAQLEARLTIEKLEQQRVSKEREAQLRLEFEQTLKEAQQQMEQQRSTMLASELQRRELEEAYAEQKKKLETATANALQTQQLLEARLTEEQEKQERLVEKYNNDHTKLLRRLAAEEHRARRFQKQIASFTEVGWLVILAFVPAFLYLTLGALSYLQTMEEVSSILTAVESDHKPLCSPVKVDKKAKATVSRSCSPRTAAYTLCACSYQFLRSQAADQLRQSIALFKRSKDEQPSDQGDGQELHDACS